MKPDRRFTPDNYWMGRSPAFRPPHGFHTAARSDASPPRPITSIPSPLEYRSSPEYTTKERSGLVSSRAWWNPLSSFGARPRLISTAPAGDQQASRDSGRPSCPPGGGRATPPPGTGPAGRERTVIYGAVSSLQVGHSVPEIQGYLRKASNFIARFYSGTR